MSAWDDFEALLDKAEPPGRSRNPPMRALERGRAQLITDEERAESDQYESSPEQRAAHRRAIADQRDPARRKILQQAYDQDTQNFTGNPLDFGPSTGEKAIDTTRPIIRNPDKSWSTERTITIEADGKHMLLPTIVDGKEYKPEEAVRLWREGKNEPVGVFGSAEEADRAARNRSERIGSVRGADAAEKSDAELGAEIISQYGNRERVESENLLDSIRSGLSKGIDLVTNVLRPRSAADRERQERRIAEASRGLNQTQRDVIERQRQTAMRSAAQPELRQDISRMRAANLEADRERKPRPYPEARIANLERQALPVNALNAAERSQMEQAQAARDVAMGDFWRNVEAGAKNLDPMYRKVMGGFLQAYGDALNAELDARGEAMDENLTGQVSDARRTATTAADMGRTFIDQAGIIERENMGDLRPGIGAQTVNSAVHSLAMMAPALAGGWLVRSPGAVIAIMSSETGAQAYGEGRKEGLSPGQAGVYALLQATIEGGTEYAPVKALFADAPEGALKWFLNFLSKEVGQEILATGLQDAVDKVSVRPEMTWQDFAHDMLVTMTSTPLAAGAQAGAARALRGREQDDAGRREEILRKFREGMAQFEKVTEQAASAARAEREARGPATHTIEGMPVRQRVEGGQPVQGVWETDEGDLVEAPRAEPLKAPEPNAEWTVNGVQYEVEIVGPGREEGTARLADGQEVPLTEFRSLGDEAKALLGIEEDLAGVKPATRRRPARGEEPPPPPGSRRPDVWPPPGFTLNPEEARRPEFTEGENKWDAIRRKKEESREAWMRRLRQRAADRKAIDVDRDTITDAIIKLGGINVSERLDLSGDDKSNRQIPFVGYLFTRQGDSVDGMAEKLYELGYIEDRSDVRTLAERIRDELGGLAQHWSMNRSEVAIGAQLQAEAEAQQPPEDQELATEADELARAPLHYDITPEDLAERELEPNAANIVIADLLSQLDEDTRERLSMQYADADDEAFIQALREELARGQYGTQTTPGTTGGRQARQLPPQYEVSREGEAEREAIDIPIGRVTQVRTKQEGRTKQGRLKSVALGEMPAPRLAERAEDVEWSEYMDFYVADINGRIVSIWKPGTEKGERDWYQVIVSGSLSHLTNYGKAATLAEAQRLAFNEHEKLPDVKQETGRNRGEQRRPRVEQPVQIYGRETADEWVARMKRSHGEKWMEAGERVIAEMKRSLPDRPRRSESTVGYTEDVLSLELTRNLISAMEMAITKAKSTTAKQPAAPEYRAQAVLDEINEDIAAGKGNATTLENDQVNAFTGLLARSGWTPIKRGKGVDWTKGSAVLFLRSQGPEAQTIVQWSIQEGGGRAEKVRGDEGQVQGRRAEREAGEVQGRADLQRAEKARAKAGDRKAPARLAKGEILKRVPALQEIMRQAEASKLFTEIRWRLELPRSPGAIYKVDKPTIVIENIEAVKPRTGAAHALLKRIYQAGGQVIPEELDAESYPFWVKMADEGLAEGQFFLEEGDTEELTERQIAEREADERSWGEAPLPEDEPAAVPKWKVGMRVVNERGTKGDITKVDRRGDEVNVEVTWDAIGGKRYTSLIMRAERPREKLRDWERLTLLKKGDDTQEAYPRGAGTVTIKVSKEEGGYGARRFTDAPHTGYQLMRAKDGTLWWGDRMELFQLGEIKVVGKDKDQPIAVFRSVPLARNTAYGVGQFGPPEAPTGDLFAKPAEAPQPKLTGPEPPLLTTPEGVAPPKDVEEQKVPTQQLKLFQPGGLYSTNPLRALEQAFGSDEALGVDFSDPDVSRFADGRSATNCTACAAQVVRALGKRAQIWGFSAESMEAVSDEGRATGKREYLAKIAELHGGHDFAIVDGRYLVDPWIKLVASDLKRAAYDLQDPADAKLVAKWYGPRELWQRLEGAEGLATRNYDKAGNTIDAAANNAEQPKSEAQAEAGNYQKGHWIVGPKGSQLDISIETPEGERRNPDWPPLKDHYGYIRGTIGFDKDHLDVFVKPGTRDDFSGKVYVVNQVIGSFDEHKVMLGYTTVEEAREAYLRNYEQGWEGLDSIIPISFRGFAQWAQTKGARGPRSGPITMEAARRFDNEVSKPTERADRDEGAQASQGDLFAQTAVPGEKAEAPLGVLFERIVVESEKVGRIRLPSGRVETGSDAALAFAQLAKGAREQFHVLALDENNVPVAYYPLFSGTVTQTSVYPREVWLAVYQTPKARKIWMAHNHPSGLPSPSSADELLTDQIKAGIGPDFGIEYMGHVIIAGDAAFQLDHGRVPFAPMMGQGVEVPLAERMIKMEQARTELLTSPGMVRDFLKAMNTDKSGLLLMDAQHRPIAYYYMTPQEMTKLRTGDLGTGFAKLMRQVGRNNPAAAIAYFPGQNYSPEIQRAVSNVGGALEGADVRMLDAFTPSAAPGGPLISFAENQRALALKPFYNLSGRWSDMTVMRLQEELMSDSLAQAMRGYIEYVDNPYQLPQDAIDDLLDMGGIAKVAGVWSPTRRKVFLVASNMQPGEARTVLLHELVGHYGMDQIFGEQYVDFMLDVYRSRAGDIQAQARPGGVLHNYQFDFRKIEHQLHAAAEFIAHAAERGEEPNLWQRFVAWVRLWLREHGYVKHWSDTDILMLLKISKSALINGGDATYNGKPAFNLKAASPIWRSTLLDRVQEFGPAKATAAEWRKFLSGMMQKGVKPDEIEWTGLREWLDTMGPMEAASKDAVLSFLTEHGVQIKERMLGELYGGTRNQEADRLLRERDNLSVALDAAGYSVIWDPNGNFRGIENRETNILYLPPGVKPNDVPGAERAIYHSVKPFEILRQRLERVTVGGTTGAIHTAVERLAEIAPITREFGDIEQTAENVTRYENWTLPGGRNYREILLTLPVAKSEYDVIIPPHARQDVYNPPHFDTINLLAHVRFNERTDADGKRVLFVEEWQSDWAEQGRKGKGFETERERQKAFLSWAIDRGYVGVVAEHMERFLETNQRGSYYQQFLTETKRKPMVPRAPFVQKTEQWTALLVKRVIRYAVENGFDRVAWTTGQQQIDRYGLQTASKDITLIRRGQTAERAWSLSGTHVRGAPWGAIDISDAEMVERVGKDIAARVHAANLQPGGSITITAKQLGVDVFYVGPKGMIKFYDEIMPIVVNNVLKKIGGGKVGSVNVVATPTGAFGTTSTRSAQPGFDITPAMRDAALRGLPMFSLKDDISRMADQIRALSRRVDQAYRRGARNAEDLDAELAELRGRYYHALEQLEGELETEAEGEDALDFATPQEHLRTYYWQYMAGQISREDMLARMRDSMQAPGTKPGTDEQMIAAGRDELAAWMARQQRKARFSLREPTGVREVYGVRDGRLLGMAVRRGMTSGLWDVYLASGANESMFTRGQFRREQAVSLNEVNRIFNREGLELNVIKPRNIPVPDTSLFDRDWVAPRADSLLRKTVINFQNRLLLPELYERTISREVGAIPPEAKAHREARIAHPRAAGKIADFEHEFTEPLVDLMRANGFTLKDVGMYLYARHAPERNAAIEAINPENRAGSGMTDERAAAVMDGLRERLGARFAAMEQIGVIANNISRFRENVLIDKGLAKLEAVALMQQKYPNYVPLKEMAEDEDIQSSNNETKGGYQVGRLLATAFGRFTEAQSEFILPALVAQAKGTISAGENAEVLRALLRLVEYAPNPDVWRIQKHVWKPYIDKDTGQVQYAPRPIQIDANYSSRAISVPVNGERVIIMLADPRLAQAYKQSGLPLDKFSQSIGVLTRFYALMATAANPEFVLTNLIRDFQQAMVRITGEQNTGLAAKVAKDVPGALWGAFAGLRAKGQLTGRAGTWHRWYRRYIEAGGHIAYRGLQDVETQHKDFMLTLAENGIMPEAVSGLEGARLRAHRGAKVVGAKYVAHLIMDANGAVENALRLSAFKNAVEAGWSEKDAAMLARNVTVDFNLKGEWSTRFGAYFMFLNANVQGTALLFRSVMNHRAIQALALLLFLSGMGFDWWNDKLSATEPDGRKVYDNINDAIKERNFILMTPDGQAAVTVPLPFGFNVFYVAGVHAMSAMRGARTPLDAAAKTFVTMINAFNPLGQSPETKIGAVQLLTPTFLDPTVQAITNRNWFDRSIVPERSKNAPPQASSATYYAGTPPAYVDVAKWLNEATGGNEVRSGVVDISPNMLEHWTRSIFGSAGAFAARVGEFGHAKLTDEDIEIRNVPFLRRFYYEPKDFELSHRFYENLNAAEVAHYEVQRAYERGQPDKAKAYAGEFTGERSMYLEAQAVERVIGQLRSEVWRVRKNDRLTDDQRTKQVEQLQERIRQAMMQFNKRFEERAGP